MGIQLFTNPPYMGGSGMGAELSKYVKKVFPDSKSDLFAVFMERCRFLTRENGYQAMITQHAWMFLSSYEKLRGKLQHTDVVNMAHLGPRAFEEIGGEVVQTTSFVFQNQHISGYQGTYCRLIEPTTQQGKEEMFLAGENRYTATQDNFAKIPGSPVAYWVSEAVYRAFASNTLADYCSPKAGLSTGDNERFLRMFWEPKIEKVYFDRHERKDLQSLPSKKKWIPHAKGGEFRRWYGNNIYVLNFENDGAELKYWLEHNPNDPKTNSFSRYIRNYEMYLKPGFSFNDVSAGRTSFRYQPSGFIPNARGPFIFSQNSNLLGYLNSKICLYFLNIISPTLTFNVGDVKRIPYYTVQENRIENMVQRCVSLSKTDWDSFETSWDFQRHPLVRDWRTVEVSFNEWTMECNQRFNQLKANEEELNRIFIDIYALQDELSPEVEDKDVTVRRADLQREVRSLISYAVGCMFGRYSLDEPGLILAGQDFSEKFTYASVPVAGSGFAGSTPLYTVKGSCYLIKGEKSVVECSFAPDEDNIIPICDDEYFPDDIVGRFVEFIRVVYGAETLEANLKFIADALGGRGTPREVIRNYFLNDFYKDHCKIYQKRPIYWLFDSGKKNGFKCLIYLHRYKRDTIARIRTDYVHAQQGRYRTAIDDLERRSGTGSASDKVKVKKQLAKLNAQAEELHQYEEKIHHLADQMIRIDLDDSVKKNYQIFKDVLAKVK